MEDNDRYSVSPHSEPAGRDTAITPGNSTRLFAADPSGYYIVCLQKAL